MSPDPELAAVAEVVTEFDAAEEVEELAAALADPAVEVAGEPASGATIALLPLAVTPASAVWLSTSDAATRDVAASEASTVDAAAGTEEFELESAVFESVGAGNDEDVDGAVAEASACAANAASDKLTCSALSDAAS